MRRNIKKPLPLIIILLVVIIGGMDYVYDGPILDGVKAVQSADEFPVSGELALPIEDSGKEGFAPKGHIDGTVTDVVDGDTINVKYGKEEYKVRLLCVDTPESVKSGVEVQPFGKESSELTERLVDGKHVKLVFDKSLYDRYGRLLAFVMLDNGQCLNALLVYEGYARVEIVSPNKTYAEWFNKLQQAALEDRAGMWALPEKKQPFVKNADGYYVPRYLSEKAS